MEISTFLTLIVGVVLGFFMKMAINLEVLSERSLKEGIVYKKIATGSNYAILKFKKSIKIFHFENGIYIQGSSYRNHYLSVSAIDLPDRFKIKKERGARRCTVYEVEKFLPEYKLFSANAGRGTLLIDGNNIPVSIHKEGTTIELTPQG